MRLALALVLATCALSAAAQTGKARAPVERNWAPLAKDGIHDPRNPGIKELQQPRDALSVLPADTAGNQVRWTDALREGKINPRTNIRPETKLRILETDIYMGRYGSVDAVRFPHREHTMWLDCSNCHEELFKSKAGANKITMLRILEGEQCGQCHGAVAFPTTECKRCHNTPRAALKPAVPQGAPR